jgi:MoxR-like ATPase
MTASTTKRTVTQLNAVTARQLEDHLILNALTSTTSYIVGKPGGGKTEIVYKAATHLGRACVVFAASEMLPEDLGGIVAPDMDALTARRLMPDVIASIVKTRESTGKPVMVFFDELNNGSMAVMASCFKLLHEGVAGGVKVPHDTVFVAAGNPPEVSSVAQELPAPLLNRMAVLRYDGPTLSEWEEHVLAHGVHAAVMGFVKQQPNYLNDEADFNSGNPCPTPRSWMAVSKVLHALDAAGNNKPGLRQAAIAARVGSKAALDMEAHLKYFDDLIPFERIIEDPETAPVSEKFAPAYMQAVAALSRMDTVAEMRACLAYFRRGLSETYPIFVTGGVGLAGKRGEEFTKILAPTDYRFVARRHAMGSQIKVS